MNRKVWVINDQEWNRKGTGSALDSPPVKPAGEEVRPSKVASRKSPAVAFSLAMLLWGGGYLYLGRYRAGAVCLTAMAFCYGTASSLAIYPQALARLVTTSGLPAAFFIGSMVVLFLAGMGLWLATAVDAYYQTVKLGAEPFVGIEREIWPLLGSLVFPGWGQFLNGQPKKGLCLFFLALPGMFSLFLFLLSREAWPLLEPGSVRLALEAGLAAGLVAIPLTLLAWIVAAYDAFQSSRLLFIRRLGMKNRGYWPGRDGTPGSLLPRASAVLGLMLAVSLGMQFIPRHYYLESLARLRGEMLKSHMKIMPELVEKAMERIDRGG